nr:hypothetical protein [Poriferisphaera corsica]
MYANDNKTFYPASTENLTSYTKDFANFPLERYLKGYIMNAQGSGWSSSTDFAGGVFLCPSSGMYLETGASQPGYRLESGEHPAEGRIHNAYYGLFHHWVRTRTSGPAGRYKPNVWREPYFSKPHGVPIQYCSTANAQRPNSISSTSWHGPDGKYGRPTAFIDGHTATLTQTKYTEYSQTIMNANAMYQGESAHAWVGKDDGTLQHARDYELDEF